MRVIRPPTSANPPDASLGVPDLPSTYERSSGEYRIGTVARAAPEVTSTAPAAPGSAMRLLDDADFADAPITPIELDLRRPVSPNASLEAYEPRASCELAPAARTRLPSSRGKVERPAHADDQLTTGAVLAGIVILIVAVALLVLASALLA